MPRKIELRTATEDDIPRIEMWAQEIDAGQYMSRHLPEQSDVLLWKIIVVDGTEAGTAWAERKGGVPSVVFLGIFIGRSELLGEGIGSTVVSDVIANVHATAGDVSIRLNVRSSNARHSLLQEMRIRPDCVRREGEHGRRSHSDNDYAVLADRRIGDNSLYERSPWRSVRRLARQTTSGQKRAVDVEVQIVDHRQEQTFDIGASIDDNLDGHPVAPFRYGSEVTVGEIAHHRRRQLSRMAENHVPNRRGRRTYPGP